MAIVYLGHDLLLGRDVAIKTLRPQFAADAAFRARFEREARAAASLSHPNIIDVFDVGDEDGLPYIVMELVRGQTLKDIIAADAPFHPDDVAELLSKLAARSTMPTPGVTSTAMSNPATSWLTDTDARESSISASPRDWRTRI